MVVASDRAPRAVGILRALSAGLAALVACAAPGPEPDWIGAFGYRPEEVHPIEIGRFGYPYVPVRLGERSLTLPFDTGNMVGLSVSKRLFDELGLTARGTYNRLDSAGAVVATLRWTEDPGVSMLGRAPAPARVYELDHPELPGLAGPTLLGGGHFTLDYGSRRIAIGTGRLPASVPGFRSLPLVRSSRHAMLILVPSTIEDRAVLLELDTGKSRSVIHPELAAELGLERGRRGVAIERLRIGDLVFSVPSAKEVDQTGIDATLPRPIEAGVGSDLLSRFVWTVDYETGLLWVPSSR